MPHLFPWKRLVLVSTLMLLACSELTEEPLPEITPEVADYTFLEIEGASAIEVAENEFVRPRTVDSLKSCVGTVSRTTTGGVTTLRITFNGQQCADQRTRAGILVVTWPTGTDSLSAQRIIRTDSLVVNGNRMRLRSVVSPAASSATKTIVSADTVRFAGGTTARWATSRTWQRTAGATTPSNLTDDEWTITGTITLRSRDSITTQVATANANPLIWRRNCTNARGQVVRGEVTITPAGGRNTTLNYGDGACDGLARLTVSGLSSDISIR